MFVKSITWCSVAVVAVLAAALLTATPVSAQSDDDQNIQTQSQRTDTDNDKDNKRLKLQDPNIKIETGACVAQDAHEGTIGVDVTNQSSHKLTYQVVVNGEEKAVTVAANSTEYIAFTELAAGDYTVEVTGPHGTKASGSATITTCHVHEQPIVDIDACGCATPGAQDGRLNLTITNPNDYAVTYTIHLGQRSKDVFVDAHTTQKVHFEHLRAGHYSIRITGDDCTHVCLDAMVEKCPEQEPTPAPQPGQGGGTPSTPPVQTPAAPVAAVATPASVTLPATLPDTSASEPTAAVQPKATANPVSFLLVAVGAALTAFGLLRRSQLARQVS